MTIMLICAGLFGWWPVLILMTIPRLARAQRIVKRPRNLGLLISQWKSGALILVMATFCCMAFGTFWNRGLVVLCGTLFLITTGPWAYAGLVVAREIERVSTLSDSDAAAYRLEHAYGGANPPGMGWLYAMLVAGVGVIAVAAAAQGKSPWLILILGSMLGSALHVFVLSCLDLYPGFSAATAQRMIDAGNRAIAESYSVFDESDEEISRQKKRRLLNGTYCNPKGLIN